MNDLIVETFEEIEDVEEVVTPSTFGTAACCVSSKELALA